jgi:CRP/FNR family transcriptional regulator, cyclic AMP receptor protein
MNVLETSISQHPLLVGLDPKFLALMAETAREVEFQPNDIVFREGDPANCLYLIQSGKMVLESRTGPNKRVPLQELESGDTLGWSWLFPPFTWHFQARAVAPTRMIACDGGHLLVNCEENHDFGYELMRRVAQVVIQRAQAARSALSAFGIGVTNSRKTPRVSVSRNAVQNGC